MVWLFWVEERKIILTLLHSPEADEDDNVPKMLPEEHVADLLADARSHEPTVAVHDRVDSNDNVNRQKHGHDKISLVLDASRCIQLVVGVVERVNAVSAGCNVVVRVNNCH